MRGPRGGHHAGLAQPGCATGHHSADVHCVSRPVAGQWQLDMAGGAGGDHPGHEAADPQRPHNPTGWTLTRPEQETILAHCRRTRTWILADGV
jgi:histidinol-phosphate/aromatic aminotransferase/cobyric acid decarboxylase-like protein